MWHNITNIAKTAAAFLQNGKAPPNTPEQLKKIMEDENHLSSKKFFIIFSASLMLALLYYSSVGILFLLPREAILVTAYVTIFVKTMEIFAVIIASYLGVQAAVDLKYNSSSNAGLQGELDILEEKLTHNAKEDDYTIQ